MPKPHRALNKSSLHDLELEGQYAYWRCYDTTRINS